MNVFVEKTGRMSIQFDPDDSPEWIEWHSGVVQEACPRISVSVENGALVLRNVGQVHLRREALNALRRAEYILSGREAAALLAGRSLREICGSPEPLKVSVQTDSPVREAAV